MEIKAPVGTQEGAGKDRRLLEAEEDLLVVCVVDTVFFSSSGILGQFQRVRNLKIDVIHTKIHLDGGKREK